MGFSMGFLVWPIGWCITPSQYRQQYCCLGKEHQLWKRCGFQFFQRSWNYFGRSYLLSIYFSLYLLSFLSFDHFAFCLFLSFHVWMNGEEVGWLVYERTSNINTPRRCIVNSRWDILFLLCRSLIPFQTALVFRSFLKPFSRLLLQSLMHSIGCFRCFTFLFP